MNNGFSNITAHNYKSFSNLNFNLEKNKKPIDLVAIYGENGSGKTNIITLFTMLRDSVYTIQNVNDNNEFIAKLGNNDSKLGIDDYLENSFKASNTSIGAVFNNSFTVGSKKDVNIVYGFKLNESNGKYSITLHKDSKTNDVKIVDEKLFYKIKSKGGEMFHISLDENGEIKTKLNSRIFKNTQIKKEIIKSSINQFWGKHTFLASLKNLAVSLNNKSAISKNIFDVISFFEDISYSESNFSNITMSSNISLTKKLMEGEIENTDANKESLEKTEEALCDYFIPLYSDIISLNYDKLEKASTITYKLIETKMIGNKEIKLPFNMESHGTKQLLKLFPLIISAINGNTVVIDEIDDGIHDLLMNKLVTNVIENIKGQLIFSTHDTSLMQHIPASSVYIIQVISGGVKKITSLSGSKIQKHNNVQNMYLKGYFSGIPYTDDVDFDSIIEGLNHGDLND